MLNENDRPSRMDNDLRYPAHAHDAPDHIEHDDAPVATETPKPFAVLEEPTWLDAEDDEELEEPRDSAFRGIWIGIAAAAVTFVLVFAVPHWLGWYDIGPSAPKAKRELNPDSVIASVTGKSAESPAAEPTAPPAPTRPPAAVEHKASAPPREARPAPREVKPAPAPREVKAAASHERKPAKGKTFAVQIAAFKNARQAGKAAENAKRAGYSADVL